MQFLKDADLVILRIVVKVVDVPISSGDRGGESTCNASDMQLMLTLPIKKFVRALA